MDTRSTNAVGFTHFTGDVVAQVGSSHGVQLTGGSTGGVVQPIGDDANITLSIRSKAAGPLNIGTSTGGPIALASSLVDVQSTRIQLGDLSTTAFSRIDRYTIQIDSGALVLGALEAGDTVSTLTGVTTNAVLIFTPGATISTAYSFQAMCSTANEVRLRIFNHDNATIGSGLSSNRGTLLAFNF